MPLPKEQINWTARVAVVLICGAVTGFGMFLLWLLSVFHAPAWVLPIVFYPWVTIVLLCVLWTIAVWAPVRGRKLAAWMLKWPWYF